MTEVLDAPPATNEAEALAGRLFEASVATMEMFAIAIGDRLGLYRALANGPATASGLAARAGIDPRYAREWLEAQAMSGFIAADLMGSEPVFFMTPAQVEVFTAETSLTYLAPAARGVIGCAVQFPAVAEAFRTGGGVSWDVYDDMRIAQAALNRPLFHHSLVQEFLPAVPGLDARLGEPGARIADVGCGGGWSSIAMATGYPGVTVDGYDLDAVALDMARENAAQAGVADRVVFHGADVTTAPAGAYDLVTAFECIHDMSDPVHVLREMRRMAAPGGTVLVMDERVADTFEPNGDIVERFMYGWSIACCLPNGMAEQPSMGTGTVLRRPVLERYAREAGFSSVDVLPIENDLFRFYVLS
jgi:SAM-dependent methyltransferase